jgi:hypothetical protein
MGIKVIGDRLIIITGKRDWEKQENEALVYRLPSLEYEGSFAIPYPNLLTTRWYGDFYVTEKLIKRNDDFFITGRYIESGSPKPSLPEDTGPTFCHPESCYAQISLSRPIV